MRGYLNAILAIIGSTSLTDEEFSLITLTDQSLNEETYLALLDVLISRESISTTRDRLKYYFLGFGVEVDDIDIRKSNIFLGAVIED